MASQRNYNTLNSFAIIVYDELKEHHPDTNFIETIALRLNVYKQFNQWKSRQRNTTLLGEVNYVIETLNSNMGNCSLGCLVQNFISLVGEEKSAGHEKSLGHE